MSLYPEPPVVVGLDDAETEVAAAALRWAAAEAAAHRAPLIVVHAFDPGGEVGVHAHEDPAATEDPGDPIERIRSLIDWAGIGPVEQVFEAGLPARVLVQRSRGARMLVLGQARRHHRAQGEEYLHGPALGPVARACVALAECPVVVVPEPVAAPAATEAEEPQSREAVHGGRALYPFQGRLPVAHQ